jgi:hypothetical protein
MRTIIYTVAAGLSLGLVAPDAGEAQGRLGDRVRGTVQDTRTRGTDAGRDTRDRRDDRDRDARRDNRGDSRLGDRVNGRQQGGPPFCSNGQGHPVHGMRWCREHGWATAVVWQRAPWGEVRMNNPQRAGRADVGRSVLVDILGQGAWGRVEAQRRALGLTDALIGRWTRENDGTAVLRLSAGGVPVAEFIDRGGNGLAEVVRINTGR